MDRISWLQVLWRSEGIREKVGMMLWKWVLERNNGTCLPSWTPNAQHMRSKPSQIQTHLEWKLSIHWAPIGHSGYYRKGWTSEKDKVGPSVMMSFQHLNSEPAEENLKDFWWSDLCPHWFVCVFLFFFFSNKEYWLIQTYLKGKIISEDLNILSLSCLHETERSYRKFEMFSIAFQKG